MSGPLNSIFAAVQPGILANLVGAGVDGANIVPLFGTTGADRNIEGVWPRIVWVPMSENIGPPVGQGGSSTLDAAGNMVLPGHATQPLATRTVSVECDLWGSDRDMVETMINAVFSAVHDALAGSYGVGAATWLLPEAVNRDGELYRITFLFAIPIVRVAPQTTTVTITSESITPQLQRLGA